MHSPWPGTFPSATSSPTHTQIIRLTLLTQIVIFLGKIHLLTIGIEGRTAGRGRCRTRTTRACSACRRRASIPSRRCRARWPAPPAPTCTKDTKSLGFQEGKKSRRRWCFGGGTKHHRNIIDANGDGAEHRGLRLAAAILVARRPQVRASGTENGSLKKPSARKPARFRPCQPRIGRFESFISKAFAGIHLILRLILPLFTQMPT